MKNKKLIIVIAVVVLLFLCVCACAIPIVFSSVNRTMNNSVSQYEKKTGYTIPDNAKNVMIEIQDDLNNNTAYLYYEISASNASELNASLRQYCTEECISLPLNETQKQALLETSKPGWNPSTLVSPRRIQNLNSGTYGITVGLLPNDSSTMGVFIATSIKR